MMLSRSHSGALPNTFMPSCCVPSAVRRSQKLGRLSIRCSGISTRIWASVAWPSRMDWAAVRRSFWRLSSTSESRFKY